MLGRDFCRYLFIFVWAFESGFWKFLSGILCTPPIEWYLTRFGEFSDWKWMIWGMSPGSGKFWSFFLYFFVTKLKLFYIKNFSLKFFMIFNAHDCYLSYCAVRENEKPNIRTSKTLCELVISNLPNNSILHYRSRSLSFFSGLLFFWKSLYIL